ADGLNTLVDFRYQQHFKGAKGGNGMGRSRSGYSSDPMVIKVPLGTQIFDEDRETLLADFTEVGQQLVLLEGGRGGLGNEFFKTSTNRAPRRSTKGKPGQELWVWLRLKLIADIGLVGLPNAGKSTFLGATTSAKPKIADYPFTTLAPNLGVVRVGHREEMVLADIPGLIEGAHEGHGLGDRFLGHVERSAALLHLIDGAAEDVVESWEIIRNELEAYGEGLAEKEEILAINKADALLPEEIEEKQQALEEASGKKVHVISAVSGHGVPLLLQELLAMVAAKKQAENPVIEDSNHPDAGWSPI
ncbi:MAG: GTPase ObgE, partial [Alphaproteobacteria bacterium]